MKKLCLLLSLLLVCICAGCKKADTQNNDPVVAYSAKAQEYLDVGDTETAIAVLEEGIKTTGSDELTSMLEQLQGSAPSACASCGASLDKDAKFCGECGEEVVIQAPVTNCPDCNAELAVGAKFCADCGKDLQQPAQTSRPEGVPEQAVEFNGHYYLLCDSTQAGSYSSAKEYCAAQGGYLAVIGSEEENRFLFDYMLKQGFGSAYFAFSDITIKDGWNWEGPEASSYSNLSDDALKMARGIDHFGLFRSDYSDGTWMVNDGIIYDVQAYDIAITTAQASSYFTEPDTAYVPAQCMDRNFMTPWVEGVDGQGCGESITFQFPSQAISSICINGGFQQRQDLYDANSRPKDLTVTLSDGTAYYITMDDLNMMQEFTFDTPVQTSSVTLTIDSVYPGLYWEDTAISEVAFRTPAEKVGFLCEWAVE